MSTAQGGFSQALTCSTGNLACTYQVSVKFGVIQIQAAQGPYQQATRWILLLALTLPLR
jgi:hypothetical protein